MPILNPIQSASLRLLKSHVLKGRIRAVAFFPDGKRIVTGHQDGSAHIWNLDTGKEDGNPLEGHSQPVTNLGVLKGGNGVVTGGSDSKVLLWTLGLDSRRKPISRSLFSALSGSGTSPAFLAFSRTNRVPKIIAAASNGLVDIWKVNPDSTNPTRINQIPVPETTITSLHFLTGHLNLLAIASNDRKLTLFNILSGKMITQLEGYSRTLLPPAWFPTMKRIVWTTHNTIYLRDVHDTVAAAETMSGHTHAVKSLAVHPGGKYPASGGEDKVLRVWDVCKRVEVGSSSLHPGAINNIAFSPDGDRILSVSQMKTVSLWSSHDLGMVEDPSAPSTSSILSGYSTDACLTNPLAKYFSKFPTFDYNAKEAATSEFCRMCKHFGWKKKDEDRKDANDAFKIALTELFNLKFGIDENSLSGWQSLCAKLGVDPIPGSIPECRKIVCTTHVNIVDLVNDSDPVKIFAKVDELSEYTKRTGKFFPRKYAIGLLKYLLRHIMCPSLDKERNADGCGSDSKAKSKSKDPSPSRKP